MILLDCSSVFDSQTLDTAYVEERKKIGVKWRYLMSSKLKSYIVGDFFRVFSNLKLVYLPANLTKSLRHREFPGGPPSKYYPGPTMLNFRDRTRTGVFIVVWS